jgi:uncharacterized membrane protein YraQ (UPF0718 family)
MGKLKEWLESDSIWTKMKKPVAWIKRVWGKVDSFMKELFTEYFFVVLYLLAGLFIAGGINDMCIANSGETAVVRILAFFASIFFFGGALVLNSLASILMKIKVEEDE